ncbi:MAG TPA: phosphodiester glycosidase family protein [Longimicrobium sp.]|jgi:uncharacterized protein YigE (DUF2233 family)
MRILLPALACLLAAPCLAQRPAPLRVDTVQQGAARVQLVRVDLRRAEVRMLWKDPSGAPFRSPAAVERWARGAGLRLLAVSNAGIFDKDRTPTGLHVERGRTLDPLNTRAGIGNFYLRPSAVFAILHDGTARIVTTERAGALRGRMREATQSGPALVLGGRIHPKFSPLPGGTPLNRTAVAVCGPREVVLAHTVDGTGITLYELARVLRDRARCPDALFLDGNDTAMLQVGGGAARGEVEFVGFIGVFAR